MFHAVDVQITRCLRGGGEAAWSYVFTMRSVVGDAVEKGEVSVQNAYQKKKTVSSLVEFLSVLLTCI